MLRRYCCAALLALGALPGLGQVHAEDCAPRYVYPQPPCNQTVKICYVELVRELTEHTRTVMRTVERDEVTCDGSGGCEGCGCKTIRKVTVQIPVQEKYTECKIVPKVVTKDEALKPVYGGQPPTCGCCK